MTTRRLAAILAADVVGYSRLMGEDEAGTALGVREHREAARPIVAGLRRAHRQDNRRRFVAGIPVRRRRGRMRDRNSETHGRAQRRHARGQAHRLPHRRQSRRRVDRGRRYSRRWGQYRGAARRPLRAGRCVGFRHRLRTHRAAGSTRNLSISARRSSRTSRGRCGFIRSQPARRVARPRRQSRPPPRRKGQARHAFRLSSCRSRILAATRNRNISSTGSPRV